MMKPTRELGASLQSDEQPKMVAKRGGVGAYDCLLTHPRVCTCSTGGLGTQPNRQLSQVTSRARGFTGLSDWIQCLGDPWRVTIDSEAAPVCVSTPPA